MVSGSPVETPNRRSGTTFTPRASTAESALVDQSVKRHFEVSAQAYARHVTPIFQPTYEYITEVAGVSGRSLSVLDVGCGDGTLAGRLADAGHRVLGIDRSTQMLALARARGDAGRWLCADAHRLPLPAGAVELGVCNLSLALFQDPAAVLAELLRVTAGGAMVVSLFSCRMLGTPDPEAIAPAAPEEVENTPLGRLIEDVTAGHAGAAGWSTRTGTAVLTGVEPVAGLLAGEIGPWSTAANRAEITEAVARTLLGRGGGTVRLVLTFSFFHAISVA